MVDFRINNLSFTYPGRDEKTLKNISFAINNGEFVVIAGKSGSGKSTLLSMLKPEITPQGKTEGEITFFGKSKKDYSPRESACDIGYLLQNTEYQTVTHSVRNELAFGLENIGLDSKAISLRIAEISAYFSLQNIIDKKTDELSGGQKQLVCLASILAMHPKVLIFDEPASQLDPMSAQTLFSAASRLCRENGMTVIITEHRLESIIPEADRLIVIDNGEIISDCHPEKLNKNLFYLNDFINLSMPSPMRIAALTGECDNLPLTIGGCRRRLEDILKDDASGEPSFSEGSEAEAIAVEAKNVYFAYNKSGYVLNKFSLSVPEGSFFAMLGANGAGKSTALSVMSGLLPLKEGKVKIYGRDIKKYKDSELYNGLISVLPQKCESLFCSNTVKEDLLNALSSSGLSKTEKEEKISEISEKCEISHILFSHPYDISGGEMQRAALSMILLKNPRIIFMDEPTKGMDSLFKKQFADIIKKLCNEKRTVIMVSHDTEFCASYSDLCAMISDGRSVSVDEKHRFFASNYFYTTAANKIARDYFPLAVTEREVVELCKKNLRN